VTSQQSDAGCPTSGPIDDVDLQIPKLRTGSSFPSLLEPRRIDRALSR
jgi:hypothetical protein